MERAEISGLGHQRLFANGMGLPLRKNLDREFRATLKRAGIDRAGLCIHSRPTQPSSQRAYPRPLSGLGWVTLRRR